MVEVGSAEPALRCGPCRDLSCICSSRGRPKGRLKRRSACLTPAPGRGGLGSGPGVPPVFPEARGFERSGDDFAAILSRRDVSELPLGQLFNP